MAQQVINIGSSANDGTGTPNRDAWDMTNDNFTELYKPFQGISIFSPTDKYCPLVVDANDGWANGQPDSGTAATHDASGAAVPSYTTAKKRQFCICTVSGTLGGRTVTKGDLLVALQDNPTTAAHWSIVADSTAEIEAAITAAQGSPIHLYGTYFFKEANSDQKKIHFLGHATIFNECGYSAIYSEDNNLRAANDFYTTVTGVGTGVGEGMDVDDNTGTKLAHVSYFNVTPGDEESVPLGAMIKVSSSAIFPGSGELSYDGQTSNFTAGRKIKGQTSLATAYIYSDSDSGSTGTLTLRDLVGVFQDNENIIEIDDAGAETVRAVVNGTISASYLTAVGRAVSVDTVNHRIYLERVVEAHDLIATASSIYLTVLHEDTPVIIKGDIMFMGKPTIIGASVGWWLTLFGDTTETGVISGSGNSRTLTMATTPNYLVNQGVHIPSRYASAASLTSHATISATRSSNVATVGFAAAHAFSVGQTVTVASLTTAWNGTVVITAINNSGPYTISYANTGSDGTAADQIGTVISAEDAFRTCKITAVNAGAKTITFETNEDSGKGDTGKTFNYPATSASVDFTSSFWSSEFNNETHGGALIMQQAHGYDVEVSVARLWAMGVRARFSDFGRKIVHGKKTVNIGTAFSGKSWRLLYLTEDYCSSCGETRVDGWAARHAWTDSNASTSVAFGPTLAIERAGVSANNRVYTNTVNDTGAPADTHPMSISAEVHSEVNYPSAWNTGHTYRPMGAQIRGSNERRFHKQRGGQTGMRMSNDAEPLSGSVHSIVLDIADIPMRDDGYAFGSNCPMGFLAQTLASIQNRSTFTGAFTFKDVACGAKLEPYNSGTLSDFDYKQVGYIGVWLQTETYLYSKMMDLDFRIPGGIATTSAATVTLGSGSKTFTGMSTGLGIKVGMRVLVQDSANPRTNYAWGSVTSYNATTLVVNLDGYKGTAASYSSWIITTGVLAPRYGIVMEGTAKINIPHLTWNVGEGNNPTEIFHSKDSTSGKVVTVGTLVINDPLNLGMPALYTSGRSADFTMNIGTIYYNGRIVSVGGIGQKAPNRIDLHAAGNANLTWTSMPSTETLITGSSGARMIRKIDLTGYSQARIVGQIQTAGTAGAKLYPKFFATYSTTIGDYTNLSSGACELVLTNTGAYESAWVDIATAAKTDVYLAIAGSGGNASDSPALGNLLVEFR